MKRFKKFGKRFLAIALIAMSVFAVAMPAGAVEGIPNNSGARIQLTDSNSNVNMRGTASSSGAIVARLGQATTLIVQSSTTTSTTINGSRVWYYVKVVTPKGNTNASTGMTGYVHSSYVVADSSVNQGGGSTGLGYINASSVNMRSAANTSASIVAVLAKNVAATVLTNVTGTAVNGSTLWYYIQASGKNGYKHRLFLPF